MRARGAGSGSGTRAVALALCLLGVPHVAAAEQQRRTRLRVRIEERTAAGRVFDSQVVGVAGSITHDLTPDVQASLELSRAFIELGRGIRHGRYLAAGVAALNVRLAEWVRVGVHAGASTLYRTGTPIVALAGFDLVFTFDDNGKFGVRGGLSYSDRTGVELGLAGISYVGELEPDFDLFLDMEFPVTLGWASAYYGARVRLDGRRLLDPNTTTLEVGVGVQGTIFSAQCSLGPCGGEDDRFGLGVFLGVEHSL